MSVSSPCEICATGTVEHTCGRCGNLVCADHFDEATGRCAECAVQTDRHVPGQPDGVDTYRF
jgi:hypothetical protein